MKTVAFDLGNVLVFFSYKKMVAQLAACTALKPEQIQELLIHRQLRDRYESGQLTDDELYSEFIQIAPKKATKTEFFHAASDIFTPNHEIVPLVHSLKKQGIRLILLSNTSSAHIDFLKPRTPLLDLFDAKIFSFEVQASKPSPKIFQAAIQAAQCEPFECFYTDDIPEYIAAGRTEGLDAELFTDVPTLRSHLTARQIPFL